MWGVAPVKILKATRNEKGKKHSSNEIKKNIAQQKSDGQTAQNVKNKKKKIYTTVQKYLNLNEI